MQVKFKAKPIEIGQVQTRGKEKPFKVIEVVVEELAEKYPATLKLEFVGDIGIGKANQIRVGQEAEFTCSITGRKWVNQGTGKTSYFMGLRVIDAVAVVPEQTEQPTLTPEEEADLPF